MTRPNSPGFIRLEGDTIVYSVSEEDVWRLVVGELRVLGEYTNDHGPWGDDYFFVFVTDHSAQWLEASFYADGQREFIAALSARLGHALRPGLSNSTDLKSRILWPELLEGKELFDFVPEARAKNLVGKLRQGIVPKVFFKLSEPVLRVIERQS
jgi:hypothetical protein